MNFKKSSGILACLLAAFFWGTTFVVQDEAAGTIPAFTFLALRSFVGAGFLVPVFLIKDKIEKRKGITPPPRSKKTLWLGGALCGAFLCAASALQQLGIGNNVGSPGKDAFITALYIVFVPLFSFFIGRRSQPHVYGCVVLALGGLWLLCMGGSELTTGDIQLIACSLLFACQMILVELIGNGADAVRLSAVQFLTVAVFSTVMALIFEIPSLGAVLDGWWTYLYAGVFSSGVAYTLQIVGQQRTQPTVACLLLSLESVVAVVAGMIALGLFPTVNEWIGMAIIFAAIVLSQIPFPYKRTAKKEQKGA